MVHVVVGTECVSQAWCVAGAEVHPARVEPQDGVGNEWVQLLLMLSSSSQIIGKEEGYGFRVEPWRIVRVMLPLIIGVRSKRVM